MMCKKEAIIFHIYGKKIFTQSHLTQVQAYFYKTFKEFKNISLCEKQERQNIQY